MASGCSPSGAVHLHPESAGAAVERAGPSGLSRLHDRRRCPGATVLQRATASQCGGVDDRASDAVLDDATAVAGVPDRTRRRPDAQPSATDQAENVQTGRHRLAAAGAARRHARSGHPSSAEKPRRPHGVLLRSRGNFHLLDLYLCSSMELLLHLAPASGPDYRDC